MLSACVAAVALTSCEKELVPQEQNTRLKSVEISLENAAFSATRGAAGDKITSGKAVVVNDLKFFLLDNTGKEYSSKVSDGSAAAQTYWTAEELASNTSRFQFHYVDHGCSKIVAVANLGSPNMTYEQFLANQTLSIDNEQDQTDLSLYAEAQLIRKGDAQHNNVNTDGTTYVSDVYEATLLLKPRIARFEVDGFRVSFNAENPKYESIKFTDMLFDHYATTTSMSTGVETESHRVLISDLNVQSTVYNWFNTEKETAWYWDSFEAEVTPTAPAASCGTLAYHAFAGTIIPRLVIKLIVDGQPAYLYTKGFYSTTTLTDGKPTLITELQEGYIYRMSAAGATDAEKDGYIPVKEDDIDPMDRCLEITVEVMPWTVELVYPEF